MRFYTVLALASLGWAVPIAQDAAPTEGGVVPTGTEAHHAHGTGDFTGHHSGIAHESGFHRHSGIAHESGVHHHSHESGHAKPTGAPILPRQDARAIDTNAVPTGIHSHRPHGTGEAGRPSGAARNSGHHGHESGHARPTGARERPSGVAHESGHARHAGHDSVDGSLTAQPTAVASAESADASPYVRRRQENSSNDINDSTDVVSSEMPAVTSATALPTGTDAGFRHKSGQAHPTGSFSFGGSGFAHPSSGFHHSHVSGVARPTGKFPHLSLPSGLLSDFSGHAKPSEFLAMMTKAIGEIEVHETGAPIVNQ